MKPDWKEKIANAPESFKARNRHLYPEPVARRVRTSQSESDQRCEGENSGVETDEESVRYSIVFVVLRRRKLDGFENQPFALKALKDRITTWLGFSNDEDPRLSWCCHQIKSDTIHGTHVLVKRL